MSFVSLDLETMKTQMGLETGSKFVMYQQINSDLSAHPMYSTSVLPEYQRVAATRFRTGSHYLKIETGRWSRIQREDRLCDCVNGGVQDERHVIEDCGHLEQIRQNYQQLDFTLENFFLTNHNDAASYVQQALQILL